MRGLARTGRNLGIYLTGIALAVAGALGLSEAIEVHMVLAACLLAIGLALVVSVHEFLDGPV